MRIKKTNDVSCRLPRVAVFADCSNSYGRRLLQGIANYVDVFGPWSLYLETAAHGDWEIDQFKDWKGDGILAYVRDIQAANSLNELKIPVVETYSDVAGIKVHTVGTDELAIGTIGARHFIERNYQQFAFVGYENEDWSRKREEGFTRYLYYQGHASETYHAPHRLENLKSWEQEQEKLQAWLLTLPRPLAIMACSDSMARSIMDCCYRAAIRIPEDIAILGVGDDEEICRLSSPSLSSIRDNPERIGYLAAEMLDNIMSGQQDAETKEPIMVPPLSIEIRQSTDHIAVEDELINRALHIIRNRYTFSIDINTVLDELDVSRALFFRRFKPALGRSPLDELTRCRIDHAKRLLASSSLGLDWIASKSGFSDSQHLCVSFKRNLKMTPIEYRKQSISQ